MKIDTTGNEKKKERKCYNKAKGIGRGNSKEKSSNECQIVQRKNREEKRQERTRYMRSKCNDRGRR
jgi:hypothetical protein